MGKFLQRSFGPAQGLGEGSTGLAPLLVSGFDDFLGLAYQFGKNREVVPAAQVILQEVQLRKFVMMRLEKIARLFQLDSQAVARGICFGGVLLG